MIKKMPFILTVILGLLVGCSNSNEKQAFEIPFEGSMEHVHGMGYAGNDQGLYFASHTGLKMYRNGKWFETSSNFNDYMGFNAVDKGFYTSGHPGADSDLPNPLGIKRSFDGGETLENIDFEGESDFHAMATGYSSHDMILMNPEKNSKLETGVYVSNDVGKSWQHVAASGLDGEILAFSIHPSNSKYIAAATTNGIYFSDNGAKSFQVVSEENNQGTAVFFNEKTLYYASYMTKSALKKYDIESGKIETMDLPKLNADGPIFIAQNPKEEAEFVIYTTKGHAYLSKDGAKSWKQIVTSGQVK